MTFPHETAKGWQFGLRELLLLISFASFCFALIAEGHWATAVLLLAIPLWCWALIQGAIVLAAAIHWHPRFSVRTFSIAVTLVCMYGACWGPTNRWGVEHVCQHIINGDAEIWETDCGVVAASRELVFRELLSNTSATIPLIVRVDEQVVTISGVQDNRRFYVWFFGYVVKLPFERELPFSSPSAQ